VTANDLPDGGAVLSTQEKAMDVPAAPLMTAGQSRRDQKLRGAVEVRRLSLVVRF
jgi:hypothetical protein